MKGIIGTAGHIDHGKTALIGALTGEQTDRLPEEQARGISIDLGFSHLEIDDGRLGVVDVPGHEDFIRNMLAGATGLDMLLLVVAADEGVMPQTREHTAIAELLGLDRAVVALTKVDLVDDDWLGLVHDDLADFLAATPFAGAPVVPTSTVTGEGLDALRAAIAEIFRGSPGRPDDLFRLPVDRAFTVRGTGTVLTGTVWSGRLARDATVRLLPDGPDARVRNLQVHGRDVEVVEPGERAAVALAGVDRSHVQRGMALVSGPGWTASSILTVRLRVLPASEWSVEARQRVRVHLGTAEAMARVVLLEGDGPLLPGAEAWAQLRLEAPLLARTGDRIVIRSYSPVTTIGGGVVAEVLAPRRARLADHDSDRLEALISGSPGRAVAALLDAGDTRGVDIDLLPMRTGATPTEVEEALAGAVRIRGRAFATAALSSIEDRITAAVDEHHSRYHLEPGIEPEPLRRACGSADPDLVNHALDGLVADGTLTIRRGAVARSGVEVTLSAAEEALRERIAQAIAAKGNAPPRLEELAHAFEGAAELEALVGLLEAEGRLVRLEHDLFIDAATLRATVAAVRHRFAGRAGVTPGDFREVVDISRKHLMPLLAYMDREGITVRSGEGRSVPS